MQQGSITLSDSPRQWIAILSSFLVDLVLVFMSLQAGAAHLAATLFGDVDLLSFQKPPISNDLDGRLKVTWDTAFPGDSDRTIDLNNGQ
jgi:hypothetical protein